MQMLWRKVRIPHRHIQRGMAQDLFQRHDMAPAHDEVSCERVAQDVACLPAWRLDRGREQDQPEHADAVGERPVGLPVLLDRSDQLRRYRDQDRHTPNAIGERDAVEIEPQLDQL